ncbi:hypothetical protein EMIHUDRAFT_119926, partial [Emiliania huxleyi CCMP1516]
ALDPDPRLWPSGREAWFSFLCIVLWNCCGYDSAGMVAAEVRSPRSSFPRALWGALALWPTLPHSFLLSTTHRRTYPLLGASLGGGGLEAALTAASAVSMAGVLFTILCTSSRALLAMATLRMLPPALGRLHPRFGTPAAAICANASLATLTLRFDDALQLSMLFYCGSAALQCAACARLRSMHPQLPRPSLLLPTPLLGLPCAVACLVLLLAPRRLLATAAAVLAALGGGHAALSALTVRCAGDAFAARVEHELETRRRPLRATVDTPRCSLPPLPCAQLSRGGSTAAAGGGEEGSRGGDDGEVLPGVLG